MRRCKRLRRRRHGTGVVRSTKSRDFGRIPGVRDCKEEAAKARAQKLRKDALEAIRDAQRAFYAEAETVEADLKKTTPAIRGLLQLLRAFDEAFTKEKRRRKLLDFSDLEHETIALLYTKDGKLSRTAREISEEYREILVDEYQDSNEVQECIFEAVSKNGQNRFLVGDVKQSIYRFRLADPGIFLQKYESYCSYEEAKDAEPRKILLSDNFRSRREVLAAANDVFSLCMQGEEPGAPVRRGGKTPRGAFLSGNGNPQGGASLHRPRQAGRGRSRARKAGGGGAVRGLAHPKDAG